MLFYTQTTRNVQKIEKSRSRYYLCQMITPSILPDQKNESPMCEMVAEVPGLLYWPEFVARDKQKMLVASLRASIKWSRVSPNEKSRRVIHYGYVYDYTHSSGLREAERIPDHLQAISDSARFPPILGRESIRFDQLIINEYLPGQGIAPHIDDPRQFCDVVFCVSLGSGTTVKFTHPDGRMVSKYIAPGSAYAMTGESRFVWKHAIDPKKSDTIDDECIPRGTRYSLTYRVAALTHLVQVID